MRFTHTLTVISLGGGVQSSVMALMASQGAFDAIPNCAIFADTHWEPPSLYTHLDWLAERLGFPVYVVDNGRSLREDVKTLTNHSGNHSFVDLPLYLKGRNGHGDGIGRRQCTEHYKIRPIQRKIRELLGLTKGQRVLLELGGDFRFMGRQRRLRIGDKWYRVDLPFFHRRLRCLVVIDLKIGGFTHADAGQMHLYLNYARAHWGREGENPPVGLVLCSEKDEALARYALEGLPNNVTAAEYRITLPNEEMLAAEIDRTRQVIESRGSIASEAPPSSGTLTVENPKE